MDMRRVLTIGAIAALVFGAGYFLWNMAGGGGQTYDSRFVGLQFNYPEDYTLEEHVEESIGRTWHVVVVTPTASLPAPQNGEGPPAIIMIAFDNIDGQTAEEWVRSFPTSTWELSYDEIESISIGGREGLAYRYTGLYENDAAVVTTERKVYFFSAGWLTPEDQIRRDFQALLASVRFLD